jgi:hypothetical protein
MSYWVVTDAHDPGNSYPTYAEAREVVVELQRKGYTEACILGDDLTWTPSWDRSGPYDRYVE